jgi:hypothetical protein
MREYQLRLPPLEVKLMELSDLTAEQLGKILFRVTNQSRRSAKNYLHSLGCSSTSEDLDAAIALANASDTAKQAADDVKADREDIGEGIDGAATEEENRVLEMLTKMIEASGKSNIQFAEEMAWQPMVMNRMLSGRKEMTLHDVCRLVVALNKQIDFKQK